MYLKNVEIHGFKSFPEKLDVEFGPGITGIVGPNGCGKTNLSDAIRWVLGEQSARQLRGKTMEDVIFNGSETRKPLGMGEVSLTIGGTAHTLAVPYDEVCVTRRVFRSGESEYFLNRKPCRLRDIKDLFRDTGVGSDTYSMMERGMIDDVLDERSGARRAFIEEAAGIHKYKDREGAARRKLELTDQDLVRLEDVIRELDKRVRSLQYQMGKARRYKRLTETLGVLEAARARSDLRRLRQRAQEIGRELDGQRARREALRGAVAEREVELENLGLRRLEYEKQLAAAQDALGEVERKAEAVESESLVLRERVKGTRALMARAGEEKGTLEKQLERARSEAEDALLALVTLEGRRSARREEVEGLEHQAGDLERELEAWRARLHEEREQALHVLEHRVRRSNDLGTLGKNLERLLEDKRRVAREISDLSERAEEIGGSLDDLDREAEGLGRDVDHLELRRVRLEGGRKKHEERLSVIHTRSVSLASRLGSLEEKLGLLKSLELSLEGYESGVKTVLAKRRGEVEGIVADLVVAREGVHAAAVSTALAQSLQWIVTTRLETACDLVDYLRTGRGGVAGFLAVDALDGQESDGVPPELTARPGVLGKALDFVDCEARVVPVARCLLGRTVLTHDLQTALRLSREPAFRRVTFVTLRGEAVTGPGRLYGGCRSEGDLGVLERRAEISKAEEQTSEVRGLLEEVRGVAAKAVRVRQRLDEVLQHVQGSIGERRESQQERRERRSAMDVERAQVDRTREMLRVQLAALEEEIRQVEAARSETAEQVTSLTGREDDAGRRLVSLEADVRAKEAACREHTARLSALRTELGGLDQEEQRLRRRKADLAEEEERLVEQIRARARDVRDADEEVRRCEAGLVRMADDLRGVSALVEERRQERDRLRQGGEGFQSREVALRQALREVSQERDGVGEEIHAREMETARLEASEKALEDQAREKFGCDLEKVEIPADVGEVGPEEVEDVREKIRALGPVNLVALEEYEQERTRFDFLTAQKTDLESAKTSLEQTIVEIHQTARKRFRETFEQVRGNFVETFRILFEEGEADLRLEDSHDPLQSGIQIIARPKGKLERHISLLSGGERSLTAIAFLVALYLVKPSAFCILDEIDAALDDANVRKFAALLERLSERTQFIMITHNKRSMGVCASLYGVTMSEPGVSRIVSVDLKNRAA